MCVDQGFLTQVILRTPAGHSAIQLDSDTYLAQDSIRFHRLSVQNCPPPPTHTSEASCGPRL